MKKWLPYIIGILIPVMIFVSFAWMIKKRTFIFRDEFILQAVKMMDEFDKEFAELVKKDILQKFAKIETRLLEKQTDGLNIFLKNQVVDSSVLENIFITDLTLNLKYFYAPYPQGKMEELAWAVKNQGGGDKIKFFFSGNSYLVYKEFKDLKIFLSMNPGLFYKTLKDHYPFFKDEMILTQKNWFLNFNERIYKNYLSYRDLSKQTEMHTESGKKTILEIKGDYIFGKKVLVKEGEREFWDFNFFAYIEPEHFPMSLWHRILLVVIAVLVIVMFLMLLFKVKNDSVMRQMGEYSSDNDDFLEKNAHTAYEDHNENGIKIIEEEDLSSEEEEEYIEIPDEYFQKDAEPAKKPNSELTHIIGEVTDHEEEVQKYNSLWKNLSNLTESENERMILGLFSDEKDEMIAHFQRNVDPESQLNVNVNNWLITQFIFKGKALFVTENAMQAKPMRDIFPSEYYSEAHSVFMAPIQNEEQEIKGLYLLFSSEKMEENKIREINSLIRMG